MMKNLLSHSGNNEKKETQGKNGYSKLNERNNCKRILFVIKGRLFQREFHRVSKGMARKINNIQEESFSTRIPFLFCSGYKFTEELYSVRGKSI